MSKQNRSFEGTRVLPIFAALFLVAIIIHLQSSFGPSLDFSALGSGLLLGILLALSVLYLYASRFYADHFYSFLSMGWLASSAVVVLGVYFRPVSPGFSSYLLTILAAVPFYLGSFLHKDQPTSWHKVFASALGWSAWLVGAFSLCSWLLNGWFSGLDFAGVWSISAFTGTPFLAWTMIRVGRCFRSRLLSSVHARWAEVLPLTFYCHAALQILYAAKLVPYFPFIITVFFVSLGLKVANGFGLLSIMRLDQINLLKQTHDLEERAHHRSEMEDLGYLTASITHEVRSPLAIINLQLRTMKQEFQTNLRLSATLGRIQEQLERIYAATGVIPLLRGSKDDSVRLMERTDVHDLIQHSVGTVRREMHSSSLYFRVECKDGLYIRAYRPMLEQAIVNILKNSVDAIKETGPKSGLIEIRSSKEPASSETIRILITDNGCGIPADIISNIMTPLFTTKPAQDAHSGIGLFISNKIVQLHGGKIQVKSVFGEGTTISVMLPRWRADEIV